MGIWATIAAWTAAEDGLRRIGRRVAGGLIVVTVIGLFASPILALWWLSRGP